MKKLYIITLIITFQFITIYTKADNQPDGYKISAISSLISSSTPALWQTANKNGIIPDENAFITEYEAYKSFKNKNNTLSAHLGADIIASFSDYKNRFFPSQLYVNLQYHILFIDFGTKNDKIKYNGLSSTNGEIQWSNNARNMPGYRFGLTKYLDAWSAIDLVFKTNNNNKSTLKYILANTAFNFNFGDYIVNDDRFSGDKTLMHKDMISIKFSHIKNIDITASLNRIIYWAGESEMYGKQPSGLSNYKRILLSEHGGNDAINGDQINRLGNSLGAYNFEIKYHFGTNKEMALYYSHPFEDKSGLQFQNQTDGVWGIYLNNGDSKLLSHFVYEYINTKNQGGVIDIIYPPTAPGEEQIRIGKGGNDNYFNNYIYKSGHTYYKRTIGSPLLYTYPSENGDICMGIRNNKLSGSHFGIDGSVTDMPYKAMFTYSHNLGRNRSDNLGVNRPDINARDYHYSLQLDVAQKLKFLDSILDYNIIKNHRLNLIFGLNYSKYGETFFSDNAWGGFAKVSFSHF